MMPEKHAATRKAFRKIMQHEETRFVLIVQKCIISRNYHNVRKKIFK